MNDIDETFKILRRSPLSVLMHEIYLERLIVYSDAKGGLAIKDCEKTRAICEKHYWNIEDIIR